MPLKADRVWPDVAIPPGETLAEELEARGWSQSELARRMRRPVQAVNEIIRGVKQITAETALQLQEVLGTSAELWVRLEGNYQLTRARLAQRHQRGIAARASVAADGPRVQYKAAATGQFVPDRDRRGRPVTVVRGGAARDKPPTRAPAKKKR